ncbi:unnamed protein product, partial [Urochloa humidicola]
DADADGDSNRGLDLAWLLPDYDEVERGLVRPEKIRKIVEFWKNVVKGGRKVSVPTIVTTGGTVGGATVLLKDPEGAMSKVIKTAAAMLKPWMYHFLWAEFEKHMADITLFGITSVVGAAAGYRTIERWRRYRALEITEVENIAATILMVVSADVLENQASTMEVIKLKSRAGFEVLVPLCVIESLEARMATVPSKRMGTVGLDSLKATPTFVTIKASTIYSRWGPNLRGHLDRVICHLK